MWLVYKRYDIFWYYTIYTLYCVQSPLSHQYTREQREGCPYTPYKYCTVQCTLIPSAPIHPGVGEGCPYSPYTRCTVLYTHPFHTNTTGRSRREVSLLTNSACILTPLRAPLPHQYTREQRWVYILL